MPHIGTPREPVMRNKKSTRIGLSDTRLTPKLLNSDEEDGDYDDRVTHTSPRKKVASKGKKQPSKGRRGAPKKKKKNIYSDDDDDDIIDDSELDGLVLSGQSESEAQETEEEEGPRRTRRAKVSYREPDSDLEELEDEPEQEEEEEEDEVLSRPRAVKKETVEVNSRPKEKSLVVTLRLPQGLKRLEDVHPEDNRRKTRATSRARSRAASTGPPPTPTTSRKTTHTRSTRQVSAGPTRKSHRLHPETPEPILVLTDSGRAAVVGEPKHPSTVFEESEENSQTQPEIKSEAAPETVIRGTEEPEDFAMAGADEAGHDTDEAPVSAGTPRNPDPDYAYDEKSAQAPETETTVPTAATEDEDDEDAIRPVTRGTRRAAAAAAAQAESTPPPTQGTPKGRITRRNARLVQKKSPVKKGVDESDDEYQEDEAASGSDESETSEHKARQTEAEEESDKPTRSRRSPNKRHLSDEEEDLAADVADLMSTRSRRKRPRLSTQTDTNGPKLRERNPVNYQILPPPDIDLYAPPQNDNYRESNKRYKDRALFPTAGRLGGYDGMGPPILGGYAGGADTDSSDDDRPGRIGNIATSPTMTNLNIGTLMGGARPTGAPGAEQPGNPANMGRLNVKSKAAALTDSDPLGVDQNINFDSVGGLEDHINQLKDMVMLPLMYPELFAKFGTTPPRGVLFHGPPGTGKTLLARALAADCSSPDGQKVTFFMRKGADVMSKWVGEAERQLRMLFEEAKKNQPSIIFFDEIDGLAPVRSSKQEQIHASIVATLLALMDGMDGRGQIIVIGATNRPDSVDPALRRPGRFDREFYFPLPGKEARRSIIDIHTRKWDPPLTAKFKDSLADFTKGYGGADLRALCTEAALNAIQRRYPQIYKSKDKLVLDINSIKITARDFMISLKKIIPSSERATSSAGAPLPEHVEPLLRGTLSKIKATLEEILPQRKQLTVLEEAEYEDDADPDAGFDREMRMREFDSGRIFRPRLLIYGKPGMGQGYLGPAILHGFEGFHVQSFDLASLTGDSAYPIDVAMINKFTEIKRHKPSVIFIPNVDVWYSTIPAQTRSTFLGLLRSIPANDPILLLGIMEAEVDDEDEEQREMLRELFSFSRQNRSEIEKPGREARFKFFERVIDQLRMAPKDFPDLANRKKRKLEDLAIAPPPPPKVITDEELKALEPTDRATLQWLKLRLMPVVEGMKNKMRRLRKPAIDPELLQGLAPEEELTEEQKAVLPYWFEVQDGQRMIYERSTGNLYYNIDLDYIEQRVSNGFYLSPDEFMADCVRLKHDARKLGWERDRDRNVKVNEFYANADIHVQEIKADSSYMAELQRMAAREKLRAERKAARKEAKRKAREEALAIEAKKAQEQELRESQQTNGIPDEANPTAGDETVLEDAHDTTNPIEESSPRRNSQPSIHFPGDITGLTGLGSSFTGSQPFTQANPQPFDASDISPSQPFPGTQIVLTQQSLVTPKISQDTQDTTAAQAGSNDESSIPSGESQSQQVQNRQDPNATTNSTYTPMLPATQEEGSMKVGVSQSTQTQSSSANNSDPKPPINIPLNESQNSHNSQDLPVDVIAKKRLSISMNSNAEITETSYSANVTREISVSHYEHGPDFSNAFPNSGDSQLPDTQSNSSLHEISQTEIAVVTAVETEERVLTLDSGRSGTTNSVPSSQATTQQQQSQRTSQQSLENALSSSPAVVNRLKLDENLFTKVRENLTIETSGFTVEQLEQVMATIMSTVWRHRNEWDRTVVAHQVEEAAREVTDDIQKMQEVMEASMNAGDRTV